MTVVSFTQLAHFCTGDTVYRQWAGLGDHDWLCWVIAGLSDGLGCGGCSECPHYKCTECLLDEMRLVYTMTTHGLVHSLQLVSTHVGRMLNIH